MGGVGTPLMGIVGSARGHHSTRLRRSGSTAGSDSDMARISASAPSTTFE